MKPSQVIFLLPSLQQNSNLRTDADHVQHISTKFCILLGSKFALQPDENYEHD
jgi:hypothetical protein